MNVTKKEALVLAQQIGPAHKRDPLVLLTYCEKESLKAGPGIYRLDVPRLEQRFMELHVRDKLEYATTTEGSLSMSYGMTQIMGLELLNMKFFHWRFLQKPDYYQSFFEHNPLNNMAVTDAIDEYCVRPDWELEYTCKILDQKEAILKGMKADGKAVDVNNFWLARAYNGDWSGKAGYAEDWTNIYERLRKELK